MDPPFFQNQNYWHISWWAQNIAQYMDVVTDRICSIDRKSSWIFSSIARSMVSNFVPLTFNCSFLFVATRQCFLSVLIRSSPSNKVFAFWKKAFLWFDGIFLMIFTNVFGTDKYEIPSLTRFFSYVVYETFIFFHSGNKFKQEFLLPLLNFHLRRTGSRFSKQLSDLLLHARVMFGSVVSAQATGSSWRRNFGCPRMENGFLFDSYWCSNSYRIFW